MTEPDRRYDRRWITITVGRGFIGRRHAQQPGTISHLARDRTVVFDLAGQLIHVIRLGSLSSELEGVGRWQHAPLHVDTGTEALPA